MDKTGIKFSDIEIKNNKIHQCKKPVSMENMFLLVKRVLNISLATKMLKN